MGTESGIDLKGIDPTLHDAIARLHREMAVNGNRREDPIRAIMGLLGDRWSTLILLVLSFGNWRHAELRRVLGRLGSEQKISQRVLTLKLRVLEREGLVIRQVIDSVPPKVSYALTPLGHFLHDQARQLIGWIVSHDALIRMARAAFDRMEA